jgi:hypothetical protein
MGVSVFPAASAGITVSDGNTAGWNLGANQVELISEFKTTTKANTITISSIPQTYRNLIIDWNGIETLGVGSHSVRLRLNNDTTSCHSESGWMNNAAGTTTPINYGTSGDGFFVGQVPSVTGGQLMHGRIVIENYTSTDAKIGTGTATYYATQDVTKVWTRLSFRTGATTNAITSITFIAGAGNNLGMQGSTSDGVRIYGVK